MVRVAIPLQDVEEFIEKGATLPEGWMWWLTSVDVGKGIWPCMILEGKVEKASDLRPLWTHARPILNPEWNRILDEDRNKRIQGGSVMAGMWPPSKEELGEAEDVLIGGIMREGKIVWQAPENLYERM